MIRRLRIMGEPYPISEVGEAAPSGIVVPPERNAVQVEFAAPDFRPGSPLQYQYKLESRGAEWSVPAGSFRILAPVWRRAWFLALAAVLGLAAAYSVHRYRVSHLIALERVRTRIVRDLHDDIGASLSQVAIKSELVSQRAAADREALQEIAGTSRVAAMHERDRGGRSTPATTACTISGNGCAGGHGRQITRNELLVLFGRSQSRWSAAR
jgi:hypothetical protein